MDSEPPPTSHRGRSRDLVAVAFCIVLPTIVTLAYFVWFAGRADSLKLAFGIGKVVQFGFPVVFVWLFARQRIGLPRKSKDGIGFGLVFGIIIASATAILYVYWLKPAGEFEQAAERIQNKVAGFGIDSAIAYFGMGVFYAAAHSFLEEYYWRWFVFGQLRPWVSKTSAIVISSLGFMAHHVIVLGIFFGWDNWLTYFLSFSVAVGGAVWAWLYDRSQSLLGPWLSHAVVDAGIFAVGYDIVKVGF
jgi:membrane protease YdiL (CAAX protease family)